jgi:hypothetical protein
MIKDYIKIINFGNNYLVHITPYLNIVVNKSFVYKNNNDLLLNDIFFGNFSTIFYSFYQFNKVITRFIKGFVFNIIVLKK